MAVGILFANTLVLNTSFEDRDVYKLAVYLPSFCLLSWLHSGGNLIEVSLELRLNARSLSGGGCSSNLEQSLA